VDVVTSLDHLGSDIPRPPHAAAHQLIELAGRLGRVELALVCDIDDFAAALLEPEPPAAMAAIADTGRAIVARNVHLLRGGACARPALQPHSTTPRSPNTANAGTWCFVTSSTMPTWR
jgi:hypothetical protein